MKKGLSLLFALLLVCSAAACALAEPWVCPNCGSEAEGNFCSQCGAAVPAQDGGDAGAPSELALSKIAEVTAHTPAPVNPSPDKYTWYVQDYVGRNLSSVGYTSIGGDRFERYGSGLLRIVPVTLDGTYADIEDESALAQYVVVGQSLAPNTEMKYVFEKDDEGNEYSSLLDAQSYDEIDLLVAPLDGVLYNEPAPYEPVAINPMTDKYTCYIKNYVGKNLAAIGYTSLGGERRDYYGDANIKLALSTQDGAVIDLEDEEQVASYVVVRQDVPANSPMNLTYMKDSDGKEYSNLIDSQSYETVTLTLRRVSTPPKRAKPAVAPASDSGAERTAQSPAMAAGTTVTDGDFTYAALEDGTLQLTRYAGHEKNVTLSSKVNGVDVTSIGPSAFEGCEEMKSLILWADIVDFGDSAFKGCTNLKEISIPGSATLIGDSVFEGCSSLESVIIWGDLERISDCAFKDCVELNDISIPSSAQSIGKSAFEGCANLDSVILWGDPEIGEAAFRGCVSLDDISISSGTALIGDYAFEGCTSLDSVILWGDTNIGVAAFRGCTSLEEISISSGTEFVGDNAFEGCTSLENVIFWGHDTKIGKDAFKDCPKLDLSRL